MARQRETQGTAEQRAERVARRWNLLAAAFAVVTGLGAALLPLGTRSSASSTGVDRTTRVSLLSSEGSSVLIVVAIPVLLVMLPLILRGAVASHRARVAIVMLLGVLVILGAMSIGVFFVPTLVAMIVSMSAQTTATRRASVESESVRVR